jgi:site-specific recombinase XerD
VRHGDVSRRTLTAPAGAELDPAGLRDRALVAPLVSTGCRISEVLTLDRAGWRRQRVIVRGKGDVERSVVITHRVTRTPVGR